MSPHPISFKNRSEEDLRIGRVIRIFPFQSTQSNVRYDAVNSDTSKLQKCLPNFHFARKENWAAYEYIL